MFLRLEVKGMSIETYFINVNLCDVNYLANKGKGETVPYTVGYFSLLKHQICNHDLFLRIVLLNEISNENYNPFCLKIVRKIVKC